LVIEQLDLQGIARAVDGSWIAVVDTKNNRRTFFLHEKDQLFNGIISKITPDRVVFQETSSDPLGKTTTREVVRRLSGE